MKIYATDTAGDGFRDCLKLNSSHLPQENRGENTLLNWLEDGLMSIMLLNDKILVSSMLNQ